MNRPRSSIISFTPYVSDAEAWRKHFENMANNELPGSGGGFQRVRNAEGVSRNKESAPVTIVNPTQAAVDRAKVDLKKAEGEAVFLTGASADRKVVRAPASKRRRKAVALEQANADDVLSQP